MTPKKCPKGMKPGSAMDKAMEKRYGVKPGSAMDRMMERTGKPPKKSSKPKRRK